MYQDFLIIALIVPNPLPIQGKHTVAEVIVEVLSVTKLSKIIKKKPPLKHPLLQVEVLADMSYK